MILLLGSDNFDYSHIKNNIGDHLFKTDKITKQYCQDNNIEWIISYNYRHIITNDVLDKYRKRAINLHISYLPYNRGADPNLWSWIDDTPKGVTIHYIDGGIDTGDIIVREKVNFSRYENNISLRDTYEILHSTIQGMFVVHWNKIRFDIVPSVTQDNSVATYHTKKDRPHLPDGWDTKVKDLKCLKLPIISTN